ncbi:MAG TPA: hypothetical protein VHF45_10770 [Thermoleophilaceae bacterium]|nr:hypothetical protein [Thermoleophilaceae bacterium]
MADRATAPSWLEEEEAQRRPELTLVVTRTDDEPPARDPETGRRTVVITGQRPAPPRRRPDAAARIGPRPDRIAGWAFFLGLFLVAVATATADAAPL